MGNQGSSVEEGYGVLHLFGNRGQNFDSQRVLSAYKLADKLGVATVSVALLGHKGEFGIMLMHEDFLVLRRVQLALADAGIVYTTSYLSITEISEYAGNLPEERRRPRLYPELPPADMPAWCFYPMSKWRQVGQNWYIQSFEERKRMMFEHGGTGKSFAGRVIQLITGSSGIDDWEWGVTLFASHPNDLKDVVYTMRYDEVSAKYADFGPFYTGIVTSPEELFAQEP